MLFQNPPKWVLDELRVMHAIHYFRIWIRITFPVFMQMWRMQKKVFLIVDVQTKAEQEEIRVGEEKGMTKIIPLNPLHPRQLEFLLQLLQSLLLLLLLLPLLKLLILSFLVLGNFSKILTWRSRVFDDGKTLRHNANFLGVISNNRGNHRQIDIPVILHFLYFQPYDAIMLLLACIREDENGDPKI